MIVFGIFIFLFVKFIIMFDYDDILLFFEDNNDLLLMFEDNDNILLIFEEDDFLEVLIFILFILYLFSKIFLLIVYFQNVIEYDV